MKILLILSLMLSGLARAETMSLVDKHGKIFVPELESWELAKKIFDMPFIYFSSLKNGQRSNISFTSTGVDIKVDFDELGRTQDVYQKNKQQWLTEVHGKLKSFRPYRKWKNNYGHIVYEIGVNFEHGSKDYAEMSYYINCHDRLIFSKSLRLSANEQHQEKFNLLITQLDCSL